MDIYRNGLAVVPTPHAFGQSFEVTNRDKLLQMLMDMMGMKPMGLRPLGSQRMNDVPTQTAGGTPQLYPGATTYPGVQSIPGTYSSAES